MVTRVARKQATAPGFDSFLDIVANLVGILVILIMVIGVRTQEAWDASANQPTPAPEPVASPDVETPKATVVSLQQEIADVTRRLGEVAAQLAERQVSRAALQKQVAAAHEAADTQRAQIQSDQHRLGELGRQQTSTYDQLAGLRHKQQAAEEQVAKPIVIPHHPTPLARTVFGREEHFRLLGGRLVHVPLNELTSQLKSEARLKAWKLENASQITEAIGPVDGFRLKYILRRRQQLVQTSAGTARRSVVELDRFVMVPVAEDLGEPLRVALESDSTFHQRLGRLDSADTTITLWTYPDSYHEFRQLKQHLHGMGYLTAARPLPHGYPIGGSPNGTRSAAQ